MKGLAFFDTNIFIYAADSRDPAKQDTALRLLQDSRKRGLAVVSLQVMQEYYAVATRKLGVESGLAQRQVEAMGQMHVVRFQPEDVISAIELHRLHQTSFWDAMILHAARISGCAAVFSEDLQNQLRIGGVRVINPFA